MWDAKEEEVDVGEVLIGKGKHKKLIVEELKAIHEYIITNATTTKIAYKLSKFYLLYKSIIIILNHKP
jgi:hypothetical protein